MKKILTGNWFYGQGVITGAQVTQIKQIFTDLLDKKQMITIKDFVLNHVS
jgi:hypothetical protein